MTDHYGLIGYPVQQSKSPIMQNEAFRLSNVDADYQLFAIEPENLGEKFHELVTSGIRGLNVTMPFKQAIIPYIDEMSALSKKLGVVNTITVQDGQVFGDITDGIGFWATIQQVPKHVVVLGTGGAARAIIASAPSESQLHVFNRMMPEFDKKAAMLAPLLDEPLHNIAYVDQFLLEADLIINATNVGMQNNQSLLSPRQFAITPNHAQVVDIIYKLTDTPFVAAAKQANRQATDGLAMLVGQGALSFERWTGIQPDQNAMLTAILREGR